MLCWVRVDLGCALRGGLSKAPGIFCARMDSTTGCIWHFFPWHVQIRVPRWQGRSPYKWLASPRLGRPLKKSFFYWITFPVLWTNRTGKSLWLNGSKMALRQRVLMILIHQRWMSSVSTHHKNMHHHLSPLSKNQLCLCSLIRHWYEICRNSSIQWNNRFAC